MKPVLPRAAFRKLAALNARMSETYDQAATTLGLACADCPDNCCHSFFQHHTQIEWAYLRQGLAGLAEPDRAVLLERAEAYLREARPLLACGELPRIACPLLDAGRCLLYAHRPMICRLHGVPGLLVKPDGSRAESPGCPRAQALVAQGRSALVLDRTPFLEALFNLEVEFLGGRSRLRRKIDLPVAGMLVLDPPR